MHQQRLAPERRIVLQQPVDIPHPVVLLPRARAFASFASVHASLGNTRDDRRPVNRRDRVRRRAHGNRVAGAENCGLLAVEERARRCTRRGAQLRTPC